MFDKRLLRLAPGVTRLIVGKVICQWIGLLANVVFMVTVVALFGLLHGCKAPIIRHSFGF